MKAQAKSEELHLGTRPVSERQSRPPELHLERKAQSQKKWEGPDAAHQQADLQHSPPALQQVPDCPAELVQQCIECLFRSRAQCAPGLQGCELGIP